MYFSLSWRNIWRNKKRTLIAAASVFFAVLLAILMRSGQLGSYSYMIHSSAKLFTGYLQVQGEGYWESRSIDDSFTFSREDIEKISKLEFVTNCTPRFETFSLVSSSINTKVSQVIGIDPILENGMTGLKKKIVMGEYLNELSSGLLVAEGLAQSLKIGIGDSLVIYGQGFHGQIAAVNLPVLGLVKLPFEMMNNGMVFLSIRKAQDVYLAFNRITSLPVVIDNIQHLDIVLQKVNEMIDPKLDIMTWDKMMPDLKQNIQLDNASGIIMLAILYIVIAFGVFGTVMMMTSERSREFAILISVGMYRRKLILLTTIETLFFSFLGVISGILAGIPMTMYLKDNPISLGGEAADLYDKLGIEPILSFSSDSVVFISQAIVVFIIAFTTAVYPLLYIRKLEPVKAIRDI